MVELNLNEVPAPKVVTRSQRGQTLGSAAALQAVNTPVHPGSGGSHVIPQVGHPIYKAAALVPTV